MRSESANAEQLIEEMFNLHHEFMVFGYKKAEQLVNIINEMDKVNIKIDLEEAKVLFRTEHGLELFLQVLEGSRDDLLRETGKKYDGYISPNIWGKLDGDDNIKCHQ